MDILQQATIDLYDGPYTITEYIQGNEKILTRMIHGMTQTALLSMKL